MDGILNINHIETVSVFVVQTGFDVESMGVAAVCKDLTSVVHNVLSKIDDEQCKLSSFKHNVYIHDYDKEDLHLNMYDDMYGTWINVLISKKEVK